MRTERERDDEATFLTRLLVRLVDGVCRHPWLALGLALITCALSVYLAVARLEFRTQRSDLISPQKEFQKRWLQYLKEFGDDDDMVVVVAGRDRPRMEEALETLARAVQAKPRLFDRLFYKLDLRPLRGRALLFLPADEIARIHENVKDMALLLDPPALAGDPLIGWKQLTLAQLLGEARRRVAALPPGTALPKDDEPFFTQLASITRTAAACLDNPNAYANPWQSIIHQPPEQKDLMAEPQYFFSGDGKLAFLLVRPVKDAKSFTSAKDSVDALQAVVGHTRAAFPELQFGLTGMPVLQNDEMVASQNDSNKASWLALAGVALLYLIVFRSLRYPLLTVSTLLVGTAWAMGWLTLTVGHLNILSTTFAVMLIGMGDYGVLWVTRYDQERAAGADVMAAMRATTASVGPSILTAATTTALAFYAAMLADFQAIAELGWIAGSGVLLCAFSCFLVLPALLKTLDRRRAPARPAAVLPLDPGGSRRVWLPALAGRPRWIIGVSLGLTVVLAAFALRVRYDHNLLHMQSPGLDSVRWEMKLIEHTAGASWHALSTTDTAEQALALKARYEKLPGVERVAEVASLVPPGQGPKLERMRDIHARLAHLPERGKLIGHHPPNPEALQRQVAEVLVGLSRSGPRPALAGLVEGLLDLNNAIGRAGAEGTARRLQRFEELMARDLADDLHRLRDVADPRPVTVADLPACLRERYVGRTGKWLLRVFGKDSLWEYDKLNRFVRAIRRVDPEATGEPFGTLECLKAMKSGFEWAGVYAFLAIFGVLLLDFRTLKHTLVSLAPLAMGIIAALGVMGLCGVALNPANMIAFPLILGVGADNGVHVLHDYLQRRRGRTYTLNHSTGQGIMVAALTTILGFGTLMISGHRGLASLGLVLTLGVTCCMLTALVFLPAVLRVLSTRQLAAALQEREEEPTVVAARPERAAA
jgi:hopanoid biosynthesis associated RND transporter like protein HpnN